MHELSLIQEIVDMALAIAEKQGAYKVHSLTLRVGQASGVEADALAFAFEAATAGTRAEGATLTIVPVEVSCHCARCNQSFQPNSYVYACPTCGQRSQTILSGTELELTGLEVSDYERN
jgi:hydrogenase nickel incorporation protein HypA/HybF